MSLLTTYQDYHLLMMAHHIEASLTASKYLSLQEAYTAVDGSKTVSVAVFIKALSPLVQSLPAEIRAQFFQEEHFKMWFSALDENYKSLVEWPVLTNALSIVAAMRKHATVLNTKFLTTKWTGPPCEKIIWVDVWRRLAVCSSTTFGVKLFSAAGTYQTTFVGHTAQVLYAAYLRPISRLCTVACDRTVVLWDHKHMSPMTVAHLECPASCVVFAPTEKYIYFSLLDGSLIGYDQTLTHVVVRSKQKHQDWVKDMLFVTELRLIVTASLDKTVILWSTEGEIVCRKVGHSRAVTCLAYMPQAKHLFSAGQGKEILVWNPFSHLSSSIQVLNGHEREVVGLFADVINKCLVSVDSGTKVVVWDVIQFSILQTIDGGESTVYHAPVKSSCQNPVTRELFLLSDHLSRATAVLSALRPPKLGSRVLDLHYSPEVQALIVSTERSIICYDVITGDFLRSLERPFGNLSGVACSSLLQDMLFISSEDGRMVFCNVSQSVPNMSTKLEPLRVRYFFPASVANVSSCRSGLAMTCKNGARFVFSFRALPDTKEVLLGQISQLPPLQGEIQHIASNPSLNFISIVHGGTITIWNSLKNSDQPLSVRSQPISSCFLPQRNALIVCQADMLSIYNVGTFILAIEVVADILQKPLKFQKKSAPTKGVSGDGESESAQEEEEEKEKEEEEQEGEQGEEKTTAALRPPPMGERILQNICVISSGDQVACQTNIPGVLATFDLFTPFSRFFSSQHGGLVEAALGEGSVLHNTHYAVMEASRVSTRRSDIYTATDRRTSEPLLVKVRKSLADHNKEVMTREAIGEDGLAAVVSFHDHWSSNEGLSVGTFPWALLMERGDVCLKEYIHTPGRYEVPLLNIDEKEFIVLNLLHVVASLHERNKLFICDLRPRSLVKVGDVWKLCSVDNLVPLNSPLPPGSAKSHLPPEVCERSTIENPDATAALNMWSVGVIAYEVAKQKQLFDNPNEIRTAYHISGLKSFQLEQICSEVAIACGPRSVLALVASKTLLLNPKERMQASSLLELIESELGKKLDFSSLFTKARCLHIAETSKLPPNVTNSVKKVIIAAGEQPGTSLVRVDKIVTVRRIVSDPSYGLLFVADENQLNGGDGSLHLVDSEFRHLGFVPPPELGEDPSCRWFWPIESHRQQRMESDDIKKDNTMLCALAGAAGENEQLSERDHRFLSGNIVCEELIPPAGWKRMTPDQLLEALLGQLQEMHSHNTSNSMINSRSGSPSVVSPTSNLLSESEIVDAFITSILQKSPFFRGGSVTGDPLPLYARVDGPRAKALSPVEAASLKQSQGAAYYKRKFDKLMLQMKKELEIDEKHQDNPYSLSSTFLREIPSLGNPVDGKSQFSERFDMLVEECEHQGLLPKNESKVKAHKHGRVSTMKIYKKFFTQGEEDTRLMSMDRERSKKAKQYLEDKELEKEINRLLKISPAKESATERALEEQRSFYRTNSHIRVVQEVEKERTRHQQEEHRRTVLSSSPNKESVQKKSVEKTV